MDSIWGIGKDEGVESEDSSLAPPERARPRFPFLDLDRPRSRPSLFALSVCFSFSRLDPVSLLLSIRFPFSRVLFLTSWTSSSRTGKVGALTARFGIADEEDLRWL